MATRAELVAAVGARMFGPAWTQPLAELSGLNHRTLDRIANAAEHGEEHDKAFGALAAVERACRAWAEELAPFRRDKELR